ncbi:hypothetical protein KP509_11G043600 [Ceratopteris richardii]|uniref:DExH-box ATP-dependent RNA helicase DExH8 n=1 Tax=Ceratopteris richardii TaxID=49495 RepID=A0A8T2TUY5_CERRI|nr:hypothetical protein KP509_11G043600 [Ceratopteris richardii]
MARSNASLPVRLQKRRILDKVQLNRVTLIVAETGTGKSTQVPQMLLEEGISPILCTQPRRLAVVAISKLVAKERGTELGGEIGFHIGQKKAVSSLSKILFETAGILLEEMRCEGAKVLSRYKVVIFDEVHERSIESDLALTCIKQFMMRNGNIRLVLMSATFDCELYKNYFKDVDRGERLEIIPISHPTGDETCILYKCQVSYLEEVTSMLSGSEAECLLSELTLPLDVESIGLGQQMQGIISDLVSHLHAESDLGKNILIFLPTYRALEEQWFLLKKKVPEVKVFVLHSSIDMDNSLKAMEVSLSQRKVILATNVAESSVTISGVSYVIDSCLSLEIFWDNERRKRLPRLVWVSKSQADQRKGRTGRTCDGHVFRMVPKGKFLNFPEYEKPAIQLLSLKEQVLTLSCSDSKAINDPRVFFPKSMDPPLETTVKNAQSALHAAGALQLAVQRGKFLPTDYGRLLASLPLSFESAILVVKGGQLGMLREAAILAALMDSSPFPIVHPFGNETLYRTFLERYYRKHDNSKGEPKSFSYASILLANLQAFDFWQCVMKDKQRLERLISHAAMLKQSSAQTLSSVEREQCWCTQHSLSLSALEAIAETSSNIVEILHLYRPTFISNVQGSPAHYIAYCFYHHTCDLQPDEEHLAEKVIMVEDEEPDNITEICADKSYVYGDQLHPSAQLDLLSNLIVQVRNDLLHENTNEEENDEVEEDQVSLCRYFQRGMCFRGSDCRYSHDLMARRSVCKYFMTETGCRYGERCDFRHPGSFETLPILNSPLTFEESYPSLNCFLDLCPNEEDGTILIYGDDDFSFTWNFSQHYSPRSLLATSTLGDDCLHLKTVTAVKERVTQLSGMGVRIRWDTDLQSLPADVWEDITCVVWNIRRVRNEEESETKRLQNFLSTLSVILFAESLAHISLILTMYNDQFSRMKVERLARECFFFLEQSIPFDSTSMGVYPPLGTYAFGVPRPVSYVFELQPPSAKQHGDCFWLLEQAFHDSAAVK